MGIKRKNLGNIKFDIPSFISMNKKKKRINSHHDTVYLLHTFQVIARYMITSRFRQRFVYLISIQ
jgi:hypothetical protein